MVDIKLKKHTEASIARRVPGIRETARKYNALCAELQKYKHGKKQLLLPLDINQLFDTNANPHMWVAEGMGGEGFEDPPAYLHDTDIREGIAALLVSDRAEEEMHRLSGQGKAMVRWLDLELKKTGHAIQICKGECLMI